MTRAMRHVDGWRTGETAQDAERCEMCGHLKECDGSSERHDLDVLDALKRMMLERPDSPLVALVRAGFPAWSLSECAMFLGYKRERVRRTSEWLEERYPAMAALWVRGNAEVRAQRSRRNREARAYARALRSHE